MDFSLPFNYEMINCGKHLDLPNCIEPNLLSEKDVVVSVHESAQLDSSSIFLNGKELYKRPFLREIVSAKSDHSKCLSEITCMSFNSEKSYLLAGTKKGNILFWDLSDLKDSKNPPNNLNNPSCSINGHKKEISCVKMIKTKTKKENGDTVDTLYSISCSPTGDDSKSIIIWDFNEKDQNSSKTKCEIHNRGVICLDIVQDIDSLPNGVVSGDRGGKIMYWDLADKKVIKQFVTSNEEEMHWVNCIRVVNNDKNSILPPIIVASMGNTYHFWNLKTGAYLNNPIKCVDLWGGCFDIIREGNNLIMPFQLDYKGNIACYKITYDSGSGYNNVKLWENGKGEDDVKHESGLSSLNIFTDEKNILRIVSCGDQSIIFWDLKSSGKGKVLHKMDDVHPAFISEAFAIKFRNNERMTLFSSSYDETIIIKEFDLKFSASLPNKLNLTLGQLAVAYTCSSTLFIRGPKTNESNVFQKTKEKESQKDIKSENNDSKDIGVKSLLPGTYLIAAKNDKTVVVHDFDNGQLVRQFGIPISEAAKLEVAVTNTDDKFSFFNCDDNISLLNCTCDGFSCNKAVNCLTCTSCNLSLHNDSSLEASIIKQSDKEITTKDNTGMKHSKEVTCVLVIHKEDLKFCNVQDFKGRSLLLTGSKDGTIIVWDFDTCEPLYQLMNKDIREKKGKATYRDQISVINYFVLDSGKLFIISSTYEGIVRVWLMHERFLCNPDKKSIPNAYFQAGWCPRSINISFDPIAERHYIEVLSPNLYCEWCILNNHQFNHWIKQNFSFKKPIENEEKRIDEIFENKKARKTDLWEIVSWRVTHSFTSRKVVKDDAIFLSFITGNQIDNTSKAAEGNEFYSCDQLIIGYDYWRRVLYLSELATRKRIEHFEMPDSSEDEFVTASAIFQPKDSTRSLVILGFSSGILRIWDLLSGKLLRTTQDSNNTINAVNIFERHDGSPYIVIFSKGGSISNFDIFTPDTFEYLNNVINYSIVPVCSSETSSAEMKAYALGTYQSTRALFDIETKELVFKLDDSENVNIRFVYEISSDSDEKLIIGTRGCYIIVWKMNVQKKNLSQWNVYKKYTLKHNDLIGDIEIYNVFPYVSNPHLISSTNSEVYVFEIFSEGESHHRLEPKFQYKGSLINKIHSNERILFPDGQDWWPPRVGRMRHKCSVLIHHGEPLIFVQKDKSNIDEEEDDGQLKIKIFNIGKNKKVPTIFIKGKDSYWIYAVEFYNDDTAHTRLFVGSWNEQIIMMYTLDGKETILKYEDQMKFKYEYPLYFYPCEPGFNCDPSLILYNFDEYDNTAKASLIIMNLNSNTISKRLGHFSHKSKLKLGHHSSQVNVLSEGVKGNTEYFSHGLDAAMYRKKDKNLDTLCLLYTHKASSDNEPNENLMFYEFDILAGKESKRFESPLQHNDRFFEASELSITLSPWKDKEENREKHILSLYNCDEKLISCWDLEYGVEYFRTTVKNRWPTPHLFQLSKDDKLNTNNRFCIFTTSNFAKIDIFDATPPSVKVLTEKKALLLSLEDTDSDSKEEKIFSDFSCFDKTVKKSDKLVNNLNHEAPIMTSFGVICHTEEITSILVFKADSPIEALIAKEDSSDECTETKKADEQFENYYIITTNADNSCILWNINSGKAIKQMIVAVDVNCAVVFKPEESFGSVDPSIIIGCADGSVSAFPLNSSSVVADPIVFNDQGLLGITSIAICCENNSDFNFGTLISHNAFIVVGTNDGKVLSVSLKCTDTLIEFQPSDGSKAHKKAVSSLQVSVFDNKTYVISGSNDMSCKVWKMSDVVSKSGVNLKLELSSPITSIISAKDSYLIIGQDSGELVLWDFLKDTSLWKSNDDQKFGSVVALFIKKVFSKETLFVSSNGNLTVWDIESITEKKSLSFIKKIDGDQWNVGLHVLLKNDDDYTWPVVISSSGTDITSTTLLPFSDPIGLYSEVKDNYSSILSDYKKNNKNNLFSKLLLLNKQIAFTAVEKKDASFFDDYQSEISSVIHLLGYEELVIDVDDFKIETKKSKIDKLKKIVTTIESAVTEIVGDENSNVELNIPDKRSLLRCAIEKGDITTLQNILKCWSKCIMEHVPKYSMYFHPSYFLLKNDLLFLSAKFPDLFRNFVTGLDYVNVHPSICLHPDETPDSHTFLSSSKHLLIKGTERIQRHVWSSHLHRHNWYNTIRNFLGITSEFSPKTKLDLESNTSQSIYGINYLFFPSFDSGHQQDMTPKRLAIMNAADIDMLLAFKNVSEALGTEIFASTMLQASEYFMQEMGHTLFYMMFIPWVCFVFIFSIALYSFDELIVSNPNNDYLMTTGWILQGAVLVGVFFNLVNEIVRFLSKQYLIEERNQLAKENAKPYTLLTHLCDFWTILNISGIGCTIAGISIRFSYGYDTEASRGLLAFASIFVWLRILQYLRAYKSCGTLIAMILDICQDISLFLAILALVITGFAFAFWVLHYNLDDNLESYPDYFHIDTSFLTVFSNMLQGGGEFNTFEGSSVPVLSTFLGVVFSVFMSIVMMNLLIAKMGNKYNEINSKATETWGLERTGVIIDLYCMCPPLIKRYVRSRIKPSVHIALRTSNLMESKVKEENDSQLKILFEKTKKLENDVGSIQNDLGKILELLTKSKEERNE